MPDLRKAVKHCLADLEGLDHEQLVAIVEALSDSDIHERKMAAVEVLNARPRLLGSQDLPLIERILRESKTWALVYGLAVSALGALLKREAEVGDTLDRWASDENFWIRRSAMLAHLRALCRGAGDFDAFVRYADSMLDESEFSIRKAIG